MGSAFHQLCPRYSGTLTPTAPTAIKLWDTFTFFVPPTVGSASSYSLHNAANSQTIHSHTQQYSNSFFLPSAIGEWNDLSLVIRDSTTVTAFKYKLNSNFTQPQSLFHIGNRIYHSRLRTNCSSFALKT